MQNWIKSYIKKATKLMQLKEKNMLAMLNMAIRDKGYNATNVNKDCVHNSTMMRGICGYNLICSSAYYIGV